jgi:uncharacterized membrane protein YdjX (TVP38/TMEM64 family)
MEPLFVGVVSVLTGLVAGGVAIFLRRRRSQRERAMGLEKLAEANAC